MTEENQRSRDRAGITSIGVIVTDGGSTDPYRLEDVVRQVHDKRIEMYAIGKSSTILFKLPNTEFHSKIKLELKDIPMH